jgi:hypothetical protein
MEVRFGEDKAKRRDAYPFLGLPDWGTHTEGTREALRCCEVWGVRRGGESQGGRLKKAVAGRKTQGSLLAPGPSTPKPQGMMPYLPALTLSVHVAI